MEEAGGTVSCMDGKNFSVFDRSVLVSNGVLHDKVRLLMFSTVILGVENMLNVDLYLPVVFLVVCGCVCGCVGVGVWVRV